jgi:pyruvate-formate lyase-activating enzyme
MATNRHNSNKPIDYSEWDSVSFTYEGWALLAARAINLKRNLDRAERMVVDLLPDPRISESTKAAVSISYAEALLWLQEAEDELKALYKSDVMVSSIS